MKKEAAFILCLVILASILFGFGSRAGLALQGAMRGDAGQNLRASDLTASIENIFDGSKVPVYSQYPFNLKNELTIASGSAQGINENDVAVSDGFLVGLVSRTFSDSALVRTIFDSRFQAPVRIGNSGADALLRGGPSPTLTLIPADAEVSEGDLVYSAAAGVPYGVPLGILQGLRDANDKVFREASLQAPYNPAGLDEVTIIPSSG